MRTNQKVDAGLPVISSLRPARWSSLLIALLTAIAAIAGLLIPNDIYPTEELRRTFLANDAVTLVIGLPILLVSLWLAWRGKLVGLLLWPGALFYGLYNYLAYLFGMPFNAMYPLYLLIVTLSAYTLIAVVAGIDGTVVKERLDGRVPARLSGGVLAGFGLLFMLRVLVEMANALSGGATIAGPELALLVTDFIMTAPWVIGGALLWRRRPLGYAGGAGLLFQGSMLFIGLIAILALQPFTSDVPFPLTDIIVVLIMGLICFVPFALYLRGVVKS